MNNMNPMQLVQSFMQFKQNFNGNPQMMIQQAIQSGRINQQQLNQAQQMATQLQNMMRGMK